MTTPEMTSKTCNTCQEHKPVTAFARHAYSRDGYVHTCSPCRREKTLEQHTDIPKPGPRWTYDLPRPNWGWQDSAACRGKDLELFFGPEGERQPEREIRERQARNVCFGCPVRGDCLDYAVSRPEKYGFYGGLSEAQRVAERRRRLRRRDAA